mmetsp:Transcript_29796/g.46733  ORF Transcript_29796/g.46733 Transcript_29796/m.46733 type:complete len:112 (+) Transcript_29796:102-437(+)
MTCWHVHHHSPSRANQSPTRHNQPITIPPQSTYHYSSSYQPITHTPTSDIPLPVNPSLTSSYQLIFHRFVGTTINNHYFTPRTIEPTNHYTTTCQPIMIPLYRPNTIDNNH